jgi:hypothetical protein
MNALHIRHQPLCGGEQTHLLALLLRIAAIIQVSGAQGPAATTSRTSVVLLTETFATVTRAPALAKMSTRQTTISSTIGNASDTTSSTIGTPTEHVPPDLFPAATHASDVHIRDETVFNYYFLFLAAFALLIAALLYWLHKQRKRRKEQMRLGGHNALSQDLDGWAGARRFMHGRYGRHRAALVRREEGLNEHGEAPPPYQPKNELLVSHQPTTTAQNSTSLAVPLRTFSRDVTNRAGPPGYSATTRTDGHVGTRPLPLEP